MTRRGISRSVGAVLQPVQAAWRDASWTASNGVASKYHIVTTDDTSACRGDPLIVEQMDDAGKTPVAQRCMRAGCKKWWPS